MWVYPWHVSANIYSTINKYRIYKLFGPGVWVCSYRILNFRIAVKQSFPFFFSLNIFFWILFKGIYSYFKKYKNKSCVSSNLVKMQFAFYNNLAPENYL